jgi:predicted MFS family arabinose efflux permease
MTFGGLGALTGTRPSAMILEFSGWRTLFLSLAILAVIVSLIIWTTVPRNGHAGTEPAASGSGGLRDILGDRLFWGFAPLVVFSQAAFLSVQTLWIGTWLRDVAGLNVIEASNVMALTTLAMIAGYLTLGWCASRLARRGISFLTTAAVGMTLYMVPQLVLIAGVGSMSTATWMLFGFSGTTSIIGFAAISRHFPVQISGRANTTLNFMIFVMAFVEQWGLGAVINRFPAPGGYDPNGYRVAFGIALSLQLVSLIWFAISQRRGRS